MTPFGTLPNPQINQHGELVHFLDIYGLNRRIIENLLLTASSFFSASGQIKSVPLLRAKAVANVFFEPSTRTRSTFEVAAKKLSADVLNLDVSHSSTSKGETLLDTIKNLQAMQIDLFVIRHQQSGTAHFVAEHVAPHVCVINAGDGRHAHPSQALLDMLTIYRHKGGFEHLSVAIIGDILHSRVARSQIHALKILGCRDIRVIGPATLLPICLKDLGVSVFDDIGSHLDGVDVIITLRLQKERMHEALIPSEQAFYDSYGLNRQRLARAKKDAIVMHPGPTNRGVEISAEVADSRQSVILEQVTVGIALRMAVMSITLGNRQKTASAL